MVSCMRESGDGSEWQGLCFQKANMTQIFINRLLVFEESEVIGDGKHLEVLYSHRKVVAIYADSQLRLYTFTGRKVRRNLTFPLRVSPFMQELILHHLHRIAQEKGIRILFACETGSRGWGFASPDSDFDIRFIYVHPQDLYLSINNPQDTINTIFEDGGEILDFNAWDLRKTLHHLRKSNATPFEWLQSPMLYYQEGNFREVLWAMAPQFFNPQAAVNHYLGICHNSIKTGISDGHIKIKKYFYILRPLLAAMWARDKQSVPPMEFQHLLIQVEDNMPFMAAIRQLLAEKELAKEGEVTPLVPVIQDFIELEMVRCRLEQLDFDKPSTNGGLLDDFFRKMLKP